MLYKYYRKVENQEVKEDNEPYLENEKLKKWLLIMPNFDNYMKNNKKKLKIEIRKGIPDSLRGQVWMKISGAEKLRKARGFLYNELINDINENEIIRIPDEEVIIKDLHRTYPDNLLFKNKLGDGQRELFRILSCISMKNKKVGYAQGMSFLVAIFLSYLDEEKSFWMMENLMKNFRLQELYLHGFPGLKKNFFVLLKLMKKLLPNIFTKLANTKLYPQIYATSWYLTCFSNVFPFYETILRIMDCYLFEGNKIIHRISLALLALKENEILQQKTYLEILEIIKTATINVDIDRLFKKSFGFSISRKKIQKYENLYKEHLNRKTPGDEDIMVQIQM